MSKRVRVSVPLRGVGCFESLLCRSQKYKKFPSPCGVWVASFYPRVFDVTVRFRPLAGCGLFHTYEEPEAVLCVSVPLRGVGCFSIDQSSSGESDCFRPLAGCGLFHLGKSFRCRRNVSVPLRGVGCFSPRRGCARGAEVSVPLRGVGCFRGRLGVTRCAGVSVPLRGVGCFFLVRKCWHTKRLFPSPCGVWVVSAKLHILSGATGKRIVNSAILLYHIGRCLSIAN